MKNWFDLKEAISGILWSNLIKISGGHIGNGVRIISPLKLKNIRNIYIGKQTRINSGVWLEVHPKTNGRLDIGDGSVLGHFNHIYAYSSIKIGKNVLTADKVYISDCSHVYDRVDLPILHQPVKALNAVEIGEGSWLGENVIVMGARIGRNCIIGSNSVVLSDIPDYSIAVGSPAKVIKHFSFEEQKWVRI